MNLRTPLGALLRLLLVACLLATVADLASARAQQKTAPASGAAEMGAMQDGTAMLSDNPGMAELMAALGPNAICPRGACGFGRDGIPEPFAGRGIQGVGAAARNAATAFPASNTALLSWLSSSDLTGSPTTANDIWGYTSPAGREYAIIGLKNGTAFVDITDASLPRVVDVIAGPISDWRDMAVFGPWAYSVNERGDGIQVIDLRKIDKGVVALARAVTDGGLRTAHNIFVNEDSGYAYLLGSNLQRGGLIAVDLSSPERPRLEPVQWDVAYVHDVQVVTYPRGKYAGREIAFAFTGPRGLHIIDVTDKSAPVTLSHLAYTNATYGHSGWLSPNRRFLYVNDELDERSNSAVDQMTTYVVRVGNLERPRLVRTVPWGTTAIDHNSMVQGDRLYVSAYRAGLRVIDISRPQAPKLRGWFDTYPDDDDTRFTGAWGIYAGFPSGNIIVSDVERGLFVIRAF